MSDVDLGQLVRGGHRRAVVQARLELLLGVAKQTELVVRLPEPLLPPPVLEGRARRRERAQLHRLARVAVVVQHVVPHSARASAGRAACLRESRFSRSTKGPPGSASMLAVPTRTARPPDVTGRDVPGRPPRSALDGHVAAPGLRAGSSSARPGAREPGHRAAALRRSAHARVGAAARRCPGAPGTCPGAGSARWRSRPAAGQPRPERTKKKREKGRGLVNDRKNDFSRIFVFPLD